jgi:uncharacterized SAM-binding protein YcdF (DUF218 family)
MVSGALSIALLVGVASKAGSFLILDAPRPADAIVVLAGETDARPRRALELARQGYSKRIVLDVPAAARLYEFTQVDLAERYAHDLQVAELPSDAVMVVCPIDGLSTKDESRDVEKCLQRQPAQSVLLVTSDFHTRRALEIFRRQLPDHQYSVAAAHSEDQFGAHWWRRRQWAKVCLEEWMKFIWWKTVDRWRG